MTRTTRANRAAARTALVAGLCLLLAGACHRRGPEPAREQSAVAPVIAMPVPSVPSLALTEDDQRAPTWRHPAVPRLVAIGDLHGDLTATRAALRLAGAIDANDAWIGARLVVVQTGDQLDRGDQEREVLELLARVAAAAKAVGGALHVLVGNHELMNVGGDFRYVTPAGFAAFAEDPGSPVAPRLERFPVAARGRAQAFLPGGTFALRLAEQPVVLAVGDSAFVHGGLGEAHVRYGLARLNREAREYMRGPGPGPGKLAEEEAPVWTRRFSAAVPPPAICDELGRVTAALGVARVVVGHTVQPRGITSACGGKIWRIDVGLAAHYGAARGVLEITPAGARALVAPR